MHPTGQRGGRCGLKLCPPATAEAELRMIRGGVCAKGVCGTNTLCKKAQLSVCLPPRRKAVGKPNGDEFALQGSWGTARAVDEESPHAQCLIQPVRESTKGDGRRDLTNLTFP